MLWITFTSGTIITEEKEVANTLNKFFVNKIIDLKKNIDPTKITDPLMQLKEKMAKTKLKFELKPVIVKEVMKTMER